MKNLILSLLCGTLFTALSSAQPGYAPLPGTGCPPPSALGYVGPGGGPKPGQNFVIGWPAGGACAGPVVAIFGLPAAPPIPLAAPPACGPGCTIGCQPIVVVAGVRHNIQVPAGIPGGAVLCVQYVCLNPGPPACVTLSEAGTVTTAC